MARQIGPRYIIGTLGDITYYKMFDIYYARMKSSLSRKKVLTSPRFARTRMHANQLAEASQIASQLYKNVPKEEKNRKFFRSIVGMAKVLLAQGEDKEVVLEMLRNVLFPEVKVIAPKQIIKRKPKQTAQKRTTESAYITKKGRLIINPLTSDVSRLTNPSPFCHLSAVNFLVADS